jgi:hypothetical protein
MYVVCPHCGQDTPASDDKRLITSCRSCDQTFEYSDQRPPHPRHRRRPRRDAPAALKVRRIPQRHQLEEGSPFRSVALRQRDDLVIEWEWSTSVAFASGLGVLMAFVILIGAPAQTLLQTLVCLGIAAGAGYSAVAHFLNRTSVTLAGDELTIAHGPIPWMRGRKLVAHKVTQLYVRRVGSLVEDKGPSYQLRATVGGGKSIRLLSTDDQEQALYLEQELEQLLELPDERVAGELEGAG